MSGSLKHKSPISYTQKFYSGKNKLSSLGNWVLRELVTFLPREDFFNLIQTCSRMRKLGLDKYVPHAISLSSEYLDGDTLISNSVLAEVIFTESLRMGISEPSCEETEVGMMLNIFYYNPKRKLAYALNQDELHVSKVEAWSLLPVLTATIEVIQEVCTVTAFGKQFYFANTVSLMSLHEGALEGLNYREDTGFSSITLELPLYKDYKLEILEGGKCVALCDSTQLTFYSYKLEPLKVCTFSKDFKLYVPLKSSTVYLIIDQTSIKLYHTYPSDPITLKAAYGYSTIEKLEAMKFGKTQALAYLTSNHIMVNKKLLCFAHTFTSFKNFVFAWSGDCLKRCNLITGKKEDLLAIKDVTSMHYIKADISKVILIYSTKLCCHIGVIPHNHKKQISFLIPLTRITEVFHREECLIVKGWVWCERSVSGMKNMAIFYNLHRLMPKRPTVALEELPFISRCQLKVETMDNYNFLEEIFNIVILFKKSLKTHNHTKPFITYLPYKAEFSTTNYYGSPFLRQLKDYHWVTGRVVDQAFQLDEPGYYLTLHFSIPAGSKIIELSIRSQSPDEVYWYEPSLIVRRLTKTV